jgi:hypothetical protein
LLEISETLGQCLDDSSLVARSATVIVHALDIQTLTLFARLLLGTPRLASAARLACRAILHALSALAVAMVLVAFLLLGIEFVVGGICWCWLCVYALSLAAWWTVGTWHGDCPSSECRAFLPPLSPGYPAD